MPYIVTTKLAGSAEMGPTLIESRCAVATLEEAKETAHVAAQGGASVAFGPLVPGRIVLAIEGLPESGGTVGPLPDGTVIEVERMTWLQFAARTPGLQLPREWQPGQYKAEILAAHNAAQQAAA